MLMFLALVLPLRRVPWLNLIFVSACMKTSWCSWDWFYRCAPCWYSGWLCFCSDLPAGKPAAVPGTGSTAAPPAGTLADRPQPPLPRSGLRLFPLPRQITLITVNSRTIFGRNISFTIFACRLHRFVKSSFVDWCRSVSSFLYSRDADADPDPNSTSSQTSWRIKIYSQQCQLSFLLVS